jgi:uncharacterized protein
LGASIFGACSRFEQTKPSHRLDIRNANIELRKAVEQAGGSNVWVKSIPAADSTPGHDTRDAAGEILATRDAVERVLTAFRTEARRLSLETHLRPMRLGRGDEAWDISMTFRDEPAGRWRLREVSRIRRAAIVIDDLGQNIEPARRLMGLPFPLTFSVLPDLPHSQRTAEEAHRKGREVMLHLPMEAEPGASTTPGPGELQVGMRGEDVARILAADLGSVPFARGVNNHMGSRATADPALMAELMQALAQRRLFFVDSRTTSESAALGAARRMGVPAFYRTVFLDDTESVAYSLGQLHQFRRVVEEQGAALAIGHPHSSTIAALAEFLPELERDDIRLVSASDLVVTPEAAHLSPVSARKDTSY